MIVRTSRGRVRPGCEGDVFARLRAASEGGARPDGLHAYFLGRHLKADGMELIAITVWRDVQALINVLGEGWESPKWLAGVDDLVTHSTVEHWETAVEAFDAGRRWRGWRRPGRRRKDGLAAGRDAFNRDRRTRPAVRDVGIRIQERAQFVDRLERIGDEHAVSALLTGHSRRALRGRGPWGATRRPRFHRPQPREPGWPRALGPGTRGPPSSGGRRTVGPRLRRPTGSEGAPRTRTPRPRVEDDRAAMLPRVLDGREPHLCVLIVFRRVGDAPALSQADRGLRVDSAPSAERRPSEIARAIGFDRRAFQRAIRLVARIRCPR